MKVIVRALKEKDKKTVVGVGSAMALLLLGIVTLSVTGGHQSIPPRSEALEIKKVAEGVKEDAFKIKVNDALTVIDKRLSIVQKEMEKGVEKNRDNSAGMALNDLSNTIKSFKTEAQKSLLKSHEENQALAKKITALEEVIASLKGGEKQTQYLDKKVLPFEVMAIDSVNEQAVLAIKYNYNHVALEKGEKLAGWKVLNVDFSQQRVEFDDEKGAHVVLSLKEESQEGKSWA